MASCQRPSSYKLTYFNITGLGEPIRFLLSYGGQNFEDNRLTIDGEDWPKLKPNTPFGQMPLLEVDGKVAHQHLAICRYLGKKFGLGGDNDWEALQIDTIADTVNDYRLKLVPTYWLADEQLKEKNYEEAIKTTIPFYLERINTLAESGYLANGKLSWADLHFVSFLDIFNVMTRFNIVEKYPNLKKVQNNVLALPSIKAYVAKRPKTQL